ncbi:hypothetical protein [Burkholderia phage FLC9]|nr:hypothetical protein [Burkholderia phage FLC9]
MSLYPKQSLQMLVDLINQANPDLPVPVTTTNVLYGAPSSVTPTGGNIQDTAIKVTAAAGTKYIGNTTLNYRRINFATLFRSLPIVIYKYSPAATGVSPYKISDLLPAINAKYGLNLTLADVADGSLGAGNTNAVPAIGLPAGTRNSSITVAAQTTSPGYVGSFTLYWVQAPQDIGTMLTVTSLENARVFPGAISSVPGDGSTPHIVDLDSYSYDWTAVFNQLMAANSLTYASFLNAMTNSGAPIGTTLTPYSTVKNAVIAQLAANSGIAYITTSPANAVGSLFGMVFKQYTLPNAAVPEANSKYFNNCFVLDILGANSWAVGRMIFHYNV